MYLPKLVRFIQISCHGRVVENLDKEILKGPRRFAGYVPRFYARVLFMTSQGSMLKVRGEIDATQLQRTACLGQSAASQAAIGNGAVPRGRLSFALRSDVSSSPDPFF